MKMILSSIILLFAFFIGCTYSHNGYIGHSINTEISLTKANYKVIKSVSGQASDDYILYFFGADEQNLMGKARRDMINKADLIGKPRAVINITTDIVTSGFIPFVITKTCYASGEVIEFTAEK